MSRPGPAALPGGNEPRGAQELLFCAVGADAAAAEAVGAVVLTTALLMYNARRCFLCEMIWTKIQKSGRRHLEKIFV